MMRLFSDIWVETSLAWYKLGTPSKDYSPLYRPYWLRARAAYLVIKAIRENDGDEGEEPLTSWAEFKASLVRTQSCSDAVAEAGLILGRSFTEQDFLTHVSISWHHFDLVSLL